jgi:hypothetical protein
MNLYQKEKGMLVEAVKVCMEKLRRDPSRLASFEKELGADIVNFASN